MRAGTPDSRSRVHDRGRGYRGVAWAITLLFLASCFALVLPGTAQTGSVLVLTKTGPSEAKVGDTITYEFAATNNEIMTPLLGAKVTDPLFGAGWSKDLGTLNPGQTKNFTQQYTVTSTDPDPLKNTATLSGTMGGSSTSASGSCTVDIKGSPKPGIQVSKTGPTDALVYETITYTVAIHNTGNVALNNVRVSDSLVSEFDWDVGDLPVGGADYKHYTYTVTPDSPYPLKNIAFATGHSPQGDYVSDKSSWTTKVPGLFGHQFSNATTRNGYQTYYGSMNLGTGTADYSVTYNGTDGTAYTQSNAIPASARGTLSAGDIPEMPAGDYTASVESDQPLVASQSTFGSWDNRISGAYGANGVSPGTRFYMPNVCTRSGYHNFTAVQNVGDTNASVTATYYGTNGDSYQQSGTASPYSRLTFGANDTPDMPPGDYSAVIESDKPIAASQSTFAEFQGRYPVAYGSSGAGELSAGTRMYVPNVCTRPGFESYTAVQNVGDTNASVTTTYYGEDGSSYQQSASVPSNARYTFAAQGTPDMPPGDYSAVIETDQPVAASQSTFGNFQGMGVTAYGSNGTVDPGTSFYMPNLSTRPGFYGYIAVQNTGDAPATVNATYHGVEGQTWTQAITVSPGARATIASHDTPDMPAGDYSAVIESDQPIAVSQSTFGDYQGMGNRAYGTSGIVK